MINERNYELEYLNLPISVMIHITWWVLFSDEKMYSIKDYYDEGFDLLTAYRKTKEDYDRGL